MGKIVGLLVLAAVFVPLERWRPLREGQRVFRPGWRADVLHFLFDRVLIAMLVLVPAGVVIWTLRGVVPSSWAEGIDGLPRWGQMMLAIVIADFTGYWTHRAFHAVPALWRLHRVHHSSVHLDWLASVRSHPLNGAISRVMLFIPLFALGFDKAILGGFAGVLMIWALVLHSNLRLDMWGVRHVVATPRFHHWHHSADLEARDANFAGLLPVWDLVFGTWRVPSTWPEGYGADRPVPDTYVGQLRHPFVAADGEEPRVLP